MAAVSTRALAIAALGLARLALVVGAASALAFGGLSLALVADPGALRSASSSTGSIIFAIRSLGLTEAWTYVRGLH